MKSEIRGQKSEVRLPHAHVSSLSVGRLPLYRTAPNTFGGWALSVGRFPILLLILLLIVSFAPAQTITLQTGQKIETQGIRRDGDMVMGKVQVGTGSGEVGYHLLCAPPHGCSTLDIDELQ